MAGGDIQWSGRAVRWLFWRLPKSAAKYTWDSNMALASDLGRRVMTLLVYGGFLWGLREFVVPLVPPLRTPVAVLILVWFWWAVSLARWMWNARPGAARNRQAMREMYQTVHEMRADVREAISTAANRIPQGGTFTMLGMKKHTDPATEEIRRAGREQAEFLRDPEVLGPGADDVPLGDSFEPLFRFPRRPGRKPKNGDQ
jgi:hypothetical protein